MKLSDIIRGKRTVAISGHIRPDGDCVGSTLATYNYIKTFFPEIEVEIFLQDIPNIFKFLTNAQQIQHVPNEKIYDLFIVQDCGDAERLGEFQSMYERAKHTFCIDHHVSNANFAEINYIDPDISSASELLYDLMEEEYMTKEIAECIYTGMVHDTGVFQYSSTTSKTMNIAGKLMDKGINFSKIIDETFYTKTFAQNQIMGRALLDSRLCLDGRCIVSQIHYEQMQEYHVLPKHLDGIVEQLRVTKGVETAVFLYQTDTESYKVSMRSKGIVNVAVIAQHFGGGGHVRAAGVTMTGDWRKIQEQIIAEVKKQLDVAFQE